MNSAKLLFSLFFLVGTHAFAFYGERVVSDNTKTGTISFASLGDFPIEVVSQRREEMTQSDPEVYETCDFTTVARIDGKKMKFMLHFNEGEVSRSPLARLFENAHPKYECDVQAARTFIEAWKNWMRAQNQSYSFSDRVIASESNLNHSFFYEHSKETDIKVEFPFGIEMEADSNWQN